MKKRNFGKVFEKYRKQKGVTQKEVADACGYTSSQFISNVGRCLCNPPLKDLKTYCNLVDMPKDLAAEILIKEYTLQVTKALK